MFKIPAIFVAIIFITTFCISCTSCCATSNAANSSNSDTTATTLEPLLHRTSSSSNKREPLTKFPFFVWPLPNYYTIGNDDSTAILSNIGREFFQLAPATKPTNTINKAIDRYVSIMFPHITKQTVSMTTAVETSTSTTKETKNQYLRREQQTTKTNYSSRSSAPRIGKSALSSVIITIENNDESHQQIDTDEWYSLYVPSSSYADGEEEVENIPAQISSITIYGALRALETLSQLIQFDFNTKEYYINNVPISITDYPRFTHRGLMIDTSRHFLPIMTIRSVIDSLPYAKINVLHWHMVDKQSFPFESTTYTKLWDGSYSKYERYTQLDIASIVEYARLRGVRVIPEFDLPGHADSWCVGYPDICPSTSCTSPLNVANDKTFHVIESLLNECTGGKSSIPNQPYGLFPDNFIHLGGDEVNTACWNTTSSIRSWLKERNMSLEGGYEYFVKRVGQIAISQGRRPIQWSEVYEHFGTKLDKKTIVHVWKSSTNISKVVQDGYNTIINVGYNTNSWYLDNLNVNWTSVYLNDPCKDLPVSLCPLVLGGHGEMWGETVDSSDIESTIWPRLAAIAERLWSPPANTMYPDKTTHERIKYFRCLLTRRGVRAAPVDNELARSAPPGPDSCYDQ